jgi:hypothetical protein
MFKNDDISITLLHSYMNTVYSEIERKCLFHFRENTKWCVFDKISPKSSEHFHFRENTLTLPFFAKIKAKETLFQNLLKIQQVIQLSSHMLLTSFGLWKSQH